MFKYMHLLVFIMVLSMVDLQAEGLDYDQQNALTETQNLLRNPILLKGFIKAHPEAKTATDQLQQVTSNVGYQQQINHLAADIFQNVVKSTQGDPGKMYQLLQRAQADPGAFANTFSDQQKRQLKQLATQIEAHNKRLSR